jgi:hypothetical protein
MGALGSKENLGQFVAIYGYDSDDFTWIDDKPRLVYHTTGIIINHQEKKYVITTREKMISCKNIVMYHSYFRGNEPVMRNDLYVIFHSIEFNIIILASVGRSELNLSDSEIITGHHEPNVICPSYNNTANKTCVVPTKRSNYSAVKMDMNLESETIDYIVNIYDVKFLSSLIFDDSYVPNNLLYEFTLKNTKDKKKEKLIGICGAAIFNKKRQLVGIISRSKGKIFHVLPRFALIKIFNDFIQYQNIPDQYEGLIHLPFDYYITKNKKIRVSDSCTIKTIDSTLANISKNDELITICDYDINIINNEAYISDDVYKEYMPLDIFVRLNYDKSTPIKIVFRHQKKLTNIDFYGIPSSEAIALSNRSYFNPSSCIPHVNINGVIIVELTHELLDLTACNKIEIKNSIVDKYFEEISGQDNINILIIIDCLDNKIVNKYNLPKILFGKRQTLICPTVLKINNKKVLNLHEVQNEVQKCNLNDAITLKIVNDNYKKEIVL